ncbi:hypothetical protein TWF694_008772 [Orbilia ellipsospora]|uniref:Uncharacterized protein n=1 Tax=Orbilia ellipsospora TaxID=2528407 RepID=A0AAV9XDG5_9PEZI
MFQSGQGTAGQPGTIDWSNSLGLAQFGQGTRKRSAPYADSDQEDEDEGITALKMKKQRMGRSSTESLFCSSLPSLGMNAFISPPVTPTPMSRRQTSDIPMEMEDMDMADSQPSLSQQQQREWNVGGLHVNVNVPAFVQQDSNLSAISMADADDEDEKEEQEEGGTVVERPHTPGIIMRDMTRLEVSPPSEIQSRRWIGMNNTGKIGGLENRQVSEEPQQDGRNLVTASSRGRFTMGYRADCEKCRNRVPGHWAHPPTI